MHTFKVGDRVRLTDCSGLIGAEQPGLVGTVDTITSGGLAVYVKWPDGTRLYYFARRFTLAGPAAPRYVVKRADEMREGEPYLDGGGCVGVGNYTTRQLDAMVEKRRDDQWTFRAGSSMSHYVVDTHDAWHTQNATPAPPPPSGPSDAEVCAAWEAAMQQRETVVVAGMRETHPSCWSVTVAKWTETDWNDYQAARSRELHRLSAAARERDRLAVVVQCQDGGADDV